MAVEATLLFLTSWRTIVVRVLAEAKSVRSSLLVYSCTGARFAEETEMR